MGTREAIHQALCAGWLTNRESGFIEYTKYLCRINKSGCSDSTGAVANQVETGYVLAAISKQRQIVQAYLRYAYGLEERSEALRTILGWGIRWSIEPKPSTAHRHARLMALAKVSTDDYRLRVAQTRSMPIEVYVKRCEHQILQETRDRKEGLITWPP